MTQEDIKNAIIALWLKRPPEQRTEADMLVFWNGLARSKPDLHRFVCDGDRWQRVSAWLKPHTK